MTLLLVGGVADLHPGHLCRAANPHLLRGGDLALPAGFRGAAAQTTRLKVHRGHERGKRKDGAGRKTLLVFPDGLHLLGVVAHVALQPDALWGALQHQLRGRRAYKHATHTQSHKVAPPGQWCAAQPVQLTSDLGDGVDDVVKHCGEKTQTLLLLVEGRRTGVLRGATLAGDVQGGGVFASVVTQHGLVDALILPGELGGKKSAVWETSCF